MRERRAEPRYEPRGRLFRAVAPDGAMLALGVLDDVSSGGVRLLTARSGPLKGGGAYVAGPFTTPVARALAEQP
jgi:hypothetical protein